MIGYYYIFWVINMTLLLDNGHYSPANLSFFFLDHQFIMLLII